MILSTPTRRTHRRRVRRAASLIGVAVVLLGCSDGSEPDAGTASTDPVASTDASVPSAERELAGIVRTPPPVVDETTLPSLTEPGGDVVFRADPGEFRAVYFGYTNCPDVCPTTMADWAVTLRRLPPELAERVDTVMVTVDPERDNAVLPGYVESFVPTALAAGTTDADQLASAAEPFGVVYSVTTADDGEVEVEHSGFLYLVDDQGRLVLTWPFGLPSQEMAADLQQLFDAQEVNS